jgi:hypothetical protein
LWQYDGNKITELTEPIRNNLGAFASGSVTSLTADFQKRRVVGIKTAAAQFIIELGDNPQLYDYSTAGFRFTTRTLVGAEVEPLLIDRIAFAYQYIGDTATLDIDVKINSTWKSENQLKIRPASDNGRCEIQPTNMLACRKFALRITNMTAGLYISRILVHLKTGGVQGYSSK